MNKVFEKIVERLILESSSCKVYKSISPNVEDVAEFNTYKKCIEIVKEVAEEYKSTDSWIPCSERLPEDGGYYLVTYHEWSKGNFLPKYNDTYVRRMHYQKSERFTGWNYPVCVDDRAENDTNREVIAWQPLPEVFKN